MVFRSSTAKLFHADLFKKNGTFLLSVCDYWWPQQDPKYSSNSTFTQMIIHKLNESKQNRNYESEKRSSRGREGWKRGGRDERRWLRLIHTFSMHVLTRKFPRTNWASQGKGINYPTFTRTHGCLFWQRAIYHLQGPYIQVREKKKQIQRA